MNLYMKVLSGASVVVAMTVLFYLYQFKQTIGEVGAYVDNTTPSLHSAVKSTHDCPQAHGYINCGKSLTRLGKHLKFRRDSCPPGSLQKMDNFRETPPLHNDCPEVFIIGARKGGTTSLYQYLSRHPDFSGINLNKGPQAGETFFFEKTRVPHLEWPEYMKFFRTVAKGKMTGESSVGNLVACHVPKTLFKLCGMYPRIIMLLRSPIERFVSNYLQRVRLRHKYTSTVQPMKDLDKFLLLAEEKGFSVHGNFKIKQDWSKLLCLYDPPKNMVFEGMYYVHALNWLCNFPEENIMIVNSEELFRNTTRVLAQVFDFVGLKPLKITELQSITQNVYNDGTFQVPQSLKLSQEERRRLMQVYGPFNEALMEFLNWSNVEWV